MRYERRADILLEFTAPRPRPGPQRPAVGATLLPLLLITDTIPAMLILALLGRVFGVRRAVTAAATPLGAGAAGPLLHNASPTAVIGLSALACMLAGTATLCSPALRRLPPPGTPSRRN